MIRAGDELSFSRSKRQAGMLSFQERNEILVESKRAALRTVAPKGHYTFLSHLNAMETAIEIKLGPQALKVSTGASKHRSYMVAGVDKGRLEQISIGQILSPTFSFHDRCGRIKRLSETR